MKCKPFGTGEFHSFAIFRQQIAIVMVTVTPYCGRDRENSYVVEGVKKWS